MGARDEAARRWFGYGCWDAPYWFVGMEPGGDDDHAGYESWLGLGGHALIDCKAHHEDSNRRARRNVTSWHRDHPVPPIETTWGPLIQVVLAYEGKPSERENVAAYQRDHWGRTSDDTAVLEISALHARNTDVAVERTLHRSERVADLKRQLAANRPKFALFYGTSYRDEYEAVAGTFNADGWRWAGPTLCVLTQHPAYRFAPPAEYWRALGAWMRGVVSDGPDHKPAKPIPRPAARPAATPPSPNPSGPPAAEPRQRRPVLASSLSFDAKDPKHTLELLDQLVEDHGFTQHEFGQLHHFGARSSMEQHIKYCRGLKNGFTAETNATVAWRLHRLLAYVGAGQNLGAAVKRVVAELPMPRP